MTASHGEALQPREYAFATPEDLGGQQAYEAICARAGLDPRPEGYGMLFCEDSDGRHWTVAGDPEYVRTCMVASALGAAGGLQLSDAAMPHRLLGWPDEW